MLKITNLSVQYDSTEVVHDLSCNLEKNEIITLVGPTGSGKTTILLAIAGLLPISKGSIKSPIWCASSENQIPTEERNVGMVFQDFALFPHLTVAQNVGFRVKDSSKIDYWLNLLGIGDVKNEMPGRLSGGQKQRVALARTLLHDPMYVLLDEPLSNLDASLKESLRWEIREALKASGVSAIWVTHDQQEAMSVGDKIGVLDSGKLIQLDRPQICFDEPQNKFVAKFLGEASFLPAKLDNDVAQTNLGRVRIKPNVKNNKNVSVLTRPWDFSLEVTADNNGKICWVHYEGSSNLSSVILNEGNEILVRTHSHLEISAGDQVKITLKDNKRFVAFSS